MESLGNSLIVSLLLSLRELGLTDVGLRTAKEWAKNGSVAMSFTASETCTELGTVKEQVEISHLKAKSAVLGNAELSTEVQARFLRLLLRTYSTSRL